MGDDDTFFLSPIRSVGLLGTTSPCHGGKTGSIPVRGAGRTEVVGYRKPILLWPKQPYTPTAPHVLPFLRLLVKLASLVTLNHAFQDRTLSGLHGRRSEGTASA